MIIQCPKCGGPMGVDRQDDDTYSCVICGKRAYKETTLTVALLSARYERIHAGNHNRNPRGAYWYS